MEKIGYSLVELATGNEVAHTVSLPLRRFKLPAGYASFTAAGQEAPDSAAPTHRLVERWSDAPPSANHVLASETPAFDGTKVVVTRTWDDPPAPTVEDVIVERQRRFDLGFDYDFGDARGVHHIGTTEQDLKGWDEVQKASAAFIALGNPTAEITIITDTGPAVITAMEFQSIMVAATLARQPIWGASFALQNMDPIPADYTDDSYWEPEE